MHDASALPNFALECRLDLVTGETKNARVLDGFDRIRFANPSPRPRTERVKKNGIVCGYSVNGYYYEVPNGKSLCWRAPPPYGAEYALLQCYPPLTEVTSVKRGDPRCGGHYETRQ